MSSLITLLTDFGTSDELVASMKGVILGICEDANIVDISHGITPYSIMKGAFILSSAVISFPPAVHVAVVDPGVGSERRGLALKTARGDVLIGPDNGLLIPAAENLGGIEKAHLIESDSFMCPQPHPTFHGRDVFAPAAANILRGANIESAGRTVSEFVPSPWKSPDITPSCISGTIIDIDRFGTARTNIKFEDFDRCGIRKGSNHLTIIEDCEMEMPFQPTYSCVDVGEALILEDSSGYIAIAVNQGSAESKFGIRVMNQIEFLI